MLHLGMQRTGNNLREDIESAFGAETRAKEKIFKPPPPPFGVYFHRMWYAWQ